MKQTTGFCIIFLLLFFPSVVLAQQESLSKGHQILLEKGLQIQAQIFPVLEDTAEVVGIDLARWAESNFTTLNFQWGWGTGVGYMGAPGSDLQWARWAPATAGGYILSVEVPYLPQAVGLQIGDEQKLLSGQMSDIAARVTDFVQRYPGQIIYTNQSPLYNGTPITVNLLKEYMATAKPDMLFFTEYPFRFEDTGGFHDYDGGSPTEMYEHLEVYRQASLIGNDGTGSSPIPFGLYTEVYSDSRAGLNHRAPSESQIRLEQFVAWAFGAKQVSAFVYDKPYSSGVISAALFTGTGDSSPTPLFAKYAELNRQSRNLGGALVRLISTGVNMKMGRHDSGTMNTLPDGVTAWSSAEDAYLKSVSAINLGSYNNGLEGDVIVGFFKPLDGSLVEAGAEDDVYFMIVNGLNDYASDAASCRQKIHLEFDFSGTDITQLLRLSRETGEVETVLVESDGGSLYHLDFELDGGTGDLFKFNTGTAFVPEPMALSMLAVGFGITMLRKRKNDIMY